jgi:hypothetical protein
VHGEAHRADALASRAEPAREPLRSSLARLLIPAPGPGPAATAAAAPAPASAAAIPIPVLTETTAPVARETVVELAARARRLIQTLFSRGLVELGASPGIDEISYQVSGLLQAHGDEAEHSLDTAEWLANEIKAIRGVVQLFATGGDIQLALRRSRAAE